MSESETLLPTEKPIIKYHTMVWLTLNGVELWFDYLGVRASKESFPFSRSAINSDLTQVRNDDKVFDTLESADYNHWYEEFQLGLV